MLSLSDYLAILPPPHSDDSGRGWIGRLQEGVKAGEAILRTASPERQRQLCSAFDRNVRTEEIKAWYSEPERGSLFQGTSISSLTLPAELDRPLDLSAGIEALELAIAKEYVRLHDAHVATVRSANLESVERWMGEGLFYGVVVSSKLLSQAFQLKAKREDLVFPVNGVMVDPHQIMAQPIEIREAYFQEARQRIECFAGYPLGRIELEQSLVLADISKPKIEQYRDHLILGPIRCNELAAVLARRAAGLIRTLSDQRIVPRSLMVTIYDTDTPYNYHNISGYAGNPAAPVLPGLTLLGCSGTIDAFRWLYAYRVSLIAQKIQKSSLWSQVEGRFIPFVYFGVLVERDADILLDLDYLDALRYPGMLSPAIEYAYLATKLDCAEPATAALFSAADELDTRLHIR